MSLRSRCTEDPGRRPVGPPGLSAVCMPRLRPSRPCRNPPRRTSPVARLQAPVDLQSGAQPSAGPSESGPIPQCSRTDLALAPSFGGRTHCRRPRLCVCPPGGCGPCQERWGPRRGQGPQAALHAVASGRGSGPASLAGRAGVACLVARNVAAARQACPFPEERVRHCRGAKAHRSHGVAAGQCRRHRGRALARP